MKWDLFFIYTDSTPHSVPSISPQKSHAVTRMHLLLLFHNFSYLLFSMLLQALGWFWCKKYRVSINETGGGRRIVLWANRICKTCRNYYTYIYYLLSLFSTFSFLKVSFEKTITFSWFFPILKPKYYIQNLPLSKTQFSHCALGENSNINFVGRCFSHLVGHIAIVIFFLPNWGSSNKW